MGDGGRNPRALAEEGRVLVLVPRVRNLYYNERHDDDDDDDEAARHESNVYSFARFLVAGWLPFLPTIYPRYRIAHPLVNGL